MRGLSESRNILGRQSIMGQVLWLIDADAAPSTFPDDLWALNRFNDELDKICKKLGVKRLSEFHDFSQVAAEFGLNVDPLVSEPAELLATVSALSAAVGSGEGAFQVSGKDRRADVEIELKNAIRVTRGFQEQSKKVRLTVVS